LQWILRRIGSLLRVVAVIHIVYRSYGGENKKGRPNYYTKLIALLSTIRAFQTLETGSAELIFLNDGPIPADRLNAMKCVGEIIQRSNLGLEGSMKAALALPASRGWKDDELVWFAEDDYLYLPHAFADLLRAAELFPQAAYFGLYAQIGDRLPNGTITDERVPKNWKDSQVTMVNGHPWRRALSTTSTFGARVRPLNEDRQLMKAAMASGGAFDHTICLMYQGFTPYSLFALTDPVRSARNAKDWLRRVAISAVRVGLNAYHLTQGLVGGSARILVASEPALSTHLEIPFLAAGNDWESVALSTKEWADSCNLA
jgi:hypothetical protein